MGRRQLENKLKISYFAIGKQNALEGEEVRVTEPPTVMLFGEQSCLTLCPVLKQSGEGKMIKWAFIIVFRNNSLTMNFFPI